MREWTFLVVALLCMGAGDVSTTGDIAGLLREFGFPIFVSLWFMWRVEKRMDHFTDTIQNLLMAVTLMAKTVDTLSPVERTQPRPHV
jgi:hypothetical protein